jgi:hypothetical protein
MPDTITHENLLPSPTHSPWRAALTKAGLVYLFSRLCVAVGAGIVAAELRADENLRITDFPKAAFADPQYANKPIPKSALRPMLDVLTSWDGQWYLRIMRGGYPIYVRPHVTYSVSDARAAFFPTYPALAHLLDKVLPGGDATAALALNFLLGAVAVAIIGLLARELFDVQVAERTMILIALFPGSFVLSFAYTEALLLTVAAACMWFLLKRNWWLAGLFAAIGTATRPNGIALVAACAVASFVAIRERREWASLVAVLLSPVGFLAFQWWLGVHTGERGVWFRVQQEAWGEGASFGLTAVRRTGKAIIHPLSSPTNTITLVTVLALVLLIWFLVQHPLPSHMTAYSIVVIVLMLIPETVTARPRFLYTAFPLFISAGVWFARSKRDYWPYVIGACAAGLVGLTALYGVIAAIP